MAHITVAHGAFSSGLGFDEQTGKNQPRYTNGEHTAGQPERITQTAERLKAGDAGLVFVNGVERLSADGRGRAGVDQFELFAEAFGATDKTFAPTVLLGERKRDRLSVHDLVDARKYAVRAPFGNAMFLRDPRFEVVGGFNAFLTTLGSYDGLEWHEPRGLSVWWIADKSTGSVFAAAVTELADRARRSDPDGIKDLENALQLVEVIQAIKTNGTSRQNLSSVAKTAPFARTVAILGGSLNRDLDVHLPSQATATDLIATHRLRSNPAIEALVRALPTRPGVTLGQFLDNEYVALAASGVTGRQRDQQPQRLDYVAAYSANSQPGKPRFGPTVEERMRVGFRTFRTNVAELGAQLDISH